MIIGLLYAFVSYSNLIQTKMDAQAEEVPEERKVRQGQDSLDNSMRKFYELFFGNIICDYDYDCVCSLCNTEKMFIPIRKISKSLLSVQLIHEIEQEVIQEPKPLLILGLSGFLVYYVKKSAYQEDKNKIQIPYGLTDKKFRMRNYYIYVRPGAIELIYYLIMRYKNVAFWTSMEEINAKPIIQKLVKFALKTFNVDSPKQEPVENYFRFIWYRNNCTRPTKANFNKEARVRPYYKKEYATIKHVGNVIADREINSTQDLTIHNTIIFDDNLEKIKSNRNFCHVPSFNPFELNNDHNQNDTFLPNLLEKIKRNELDIS